ncbi:CoA transferase [Halomonas huangheensis]|uniref:Carnitine dehydratase n=1 Tax=Halomonas huangheensis TaxID=1178482 RepID=W1N2Y9_9GAMM|nr:CoA transferase [Halomonas huangheensis]ALM52375.1 carnitine dehydratase [Halomonas huangheensis]ERL49315.1 hypothetical protein BJB45_07530 [Halomonas huangheensis]
MTFPLTGCLLSGRYDHASSAFERCASTLHAQAEALAISSTSQPVVDIHGLELDFEVPGLAPIHGSLLGWSGGCREPVSELAIQAASGLMAVHGRASGGPRPLGIDYVSTLATSLTLLGTFACALGQLRGKRHSRVEMSLASAAALSIGQYLAGATAADNPEQLLPGCSSPHERPPFTSADGVVFELESLHADPWRRFWNGLGVVDEVAGRGWKAFLMRYAKAVSPIPAEMMEVLARLPYALIAQRCREAGVSICPLRRLTDRLMDQDLPQLLEQGPWQFTPGMANLPPFERHEGGGLPLEGITVVESCRRIQGPLAGHLMALLGAEVVRIEMPGGDPLRGMPPLMNGCSVRFDALNRYKRVLELDIKSARGRSELLEMVRGADVFLHNWAPGKAAELQLDHEHLVRANPALIYAYAGGWGANNGLDDMPGTDFMVQAWSGIAHQIAHNSPSIGGSLFTVLDIMGGVVAAQGIGAALLGRALNGESGRVDSSLLGAASLLCCETLQTLRNCRPLREPVLAGVYPTAEGPLILECHDQVQLERLAAILDCRLDTEPVVRDEEITRCLATHDAATWQSLLRDAGLMASCVQEDLSALHQDERIAACLETDGYTLVKSPWRFA